MRIRRAVLTSTLAYGVLALWSTSALAAGAPEAPSSEAATGIAATSATLNGTLNPNATATTGWYFAYSTQSSCKGAATTPVEAEAEVQATHESTQITDLTPNTQYTICLVAKNASGETYGPEITFKTYARSQLLRLGPFEYVSGVAVDQMNGNVFVIDDGNNENIGGVNADEGIHVFGAEGGSPVGGFPSKLTFITQGRKRTGIAVYDSGGTFALYVTNDLHNVVDKFTLNSSHEYQYVCEFVGPGARCVKEEGELKAGEPTQHFLNVADVAVDSQGNVYITSEQPERGLVDKFNAAGEYIWGLSHTNTPDILTPAGVAADNDGNVYIVTAKDIESGRGVVKLEVGPDGTVHHEEVFFSGGEFVIGLGGESELAYSATGVTVEQSTGNVFIHRVAKTLEPASLIVERNVFDATLGEFDIPEVGVRGEEVAKGVSNGILSESSDQLGLAVREDEAANDVYFSYREYNSGKEPISYVGVFGSLPPSVRVTTRPASGVQGTTARVNGTVNPGGVALTGCSFEWGSSAGYGRLPVSCSPKVSEIAVGGGPVAVSAVLTGLLPNVVYHYELVAENAEGRSGKGGDGTVLVPVRPRVDDLRPSVVPTRTTAQFLGTVDPENSPTNYHYVYVAEAGYLPAAKNPYAAGGETPMVAAGSGLGDEALPQVVITGLTAGRTYHYALVANNAAGSETGPDYTFTTAARTPPVVSTGAASAVGLTTATISGTVDPQGVQTSYEFDLGPDTSYGGARVFGNAGQDAGSESVTLSLEDLVPDTTYHYRVAATNQDGTSYGADRTFTTASAPSPIVQPLAQALIATPVVTFPTEAGTVTAAKGTGAGSKQKTRTKRRRTKRRRSKRRGTKRKRAKEPRGRKDRKSSVVGHNQADGGAR